MPAATKNVPDAQGRFGEFGRRFVPETLMHALEELTAEYELAKADPEFQRELADLYKHFVGRPSPLYFAELAKILSAHADSWGLQCSGDSDHWGWDSLTFSSHPNPAARGT